MHLYTLIVNTIMSFWLGIGAIKTIDLIGVERKPVDKVLARRVALTALVLIVLLTVSSVLNGRS